MGIPVAFPTVTLLAGILTEGGGIKVSGRTAKLRVELTVKASIVVATTILCGRVDDAHQFQVSAINHRNAQSGSGSHGNDIVILARNRIQGCSLVIVAALYPPCIVPLRVPPPHVVTHGAVKLGRFTRGKLVVVRRVELATAMVLVNQVAAQAKQ